MTSTQYKLTAYAFISDAIAFSSLILEDNNIKVLLFLSAHSIASLMLSFVIYIYLLPKKYKYQKILVLLFIFIFVFFIPFLSYVAFFIFSLILKAQKVKEIKFNYLESNKLFLTDEVLTIERFFGEGALLTYITNKNLNPDLRLKAFLIISDIISPTTINFMKLGLSDPIDEIRLLSFSIINNLEKKINNEIFKIKNLLEKKEGDEIKLKLQLSKLEWELIYLNLVDDTFQEILISEILAILDGIKIKEAKILLIKIYLLKKDYEKVKNILNTLKIDTETLPYFLEIHFYKKDYEKIKGLIKQYPEIKFIEKFYFIYRLWNDN